MDFINRSFEQLSELFRSLTPGGRITAALLLVVVVVSVAYLFNAKTEGPDEYLLGGQSFTTEEIVAMQGAFGKAGLSNFDVEGGQIRIPKAQQAAYLAALADDDALPHSFGSYFAQALDKSTMMGTTSDRQRAHRVAMLMELSNIIRELPYVDKASVVYDAKRPPGFLRQPQTKATATVTPRGSRPLDSQQVLAIRSIVAGGVGVQPGDVIVVDTNGPTHNATSDDAVASGTDDPYYKTKVTHEQRYENKIYSALSYIPGVSVTVDVELDRTTKNVSEKLKIDTEDSVVLNSRSDKHKNTTRQQPGSRVGLAAQSEANSALSLGGGGGGGGTESVQTDDVKEDSRTAPHETIHTEMAALTPQSVTVAVNVPQSYIEGIFRDQQPPPAEGEEPAEPTEQQLLDIEATVKKELMTTVPNMIPRAEGVAPEDAVKVAFVRTAKLPEVEGPPITDAATSWLAANWTTLGMFGFAGFGLIMLRSMLKATPAVERLAPHAAPAVGPTDSDEYEETTDSAQPKRHLRRNIPSGPNLAEELADIVKEDTEAAANVLRGWITSGT